MDIAALVRAVTAAYEDASQLVKRIREHRESSQDRVLPEEPTRDLLDSLALGPIIIRGHFDHDLKRFGESYACGDNLAREQMKDVLISLQMTLIITLRSVWMDDMDLDYTILQSTSDDSRVNAGVCLGQLSQRLSEALKAQSMYSQSMTSYPQASGLMPPMSPSLAYSSSRSTHSSSNYPAPRTPDTLTDHFANLGIGSSGPGTYMERKTSISSGGSQISFPKVPTVKWGPPENRGSLPSVGVHRVSDQDAESMRRPSSHTLGTDDNLLLLSIQDTPPTQPTPGALSGNQDLDQESYMSSAVEGQTQSSTGISRTSSESHKADTKDPFGPDDYNRNNVNTDGREYRYGTIYDVSREKISARSKPVATSQPHRTQDNNNNHSTLEHIRYLQQNSRPPMQVNNRLILSEKPLPRIDSLAGPRKPVPTYAPPPPPNVSTSDTSSVSLQSFPRPTTSTPIPVDGTNQISALPRPRALAHQVDRPASRTTTTSSIPQGPLVLPTDKNLQGFCKGAFRLQIGLEKKAFTVANRPAGFSGMVSYWRCDKCNFEGPVYSTVISEGKKKGKPEKLFDPKIRVSAGGGVRYRWAFLAKCHVGLKGMVEGTRDGSFGSFGCLYCCAEGALRGWNGNANTNGNLADNVSTNGSIKTTSTTAAGTPIFGNVASFMEHLETHREEAGWPNAEMLGRTKCVVGRVAEVYEEWDVNFVPL